MVETTPGGTAPGETAPGGATPGGMAGAAGAAGALLGMTGASPGRSGVRAVAPALGGWISCLTRVRHRSQVSRRRRIHRGRLAKKNGGRRRP